MRKFICSFFGKEKIEVDLGKISKEDKSTKGGTLFLFPKQTKVLSELEIEKVKKAFPQHGKKLFVHREIEKKVDVKTEAKEQEKKDAAKKTSAKKPSSQKKIPSTPSLKKKTDI